MAGKAGYVAARELMVFGVKGVHANIMSSVTFKCYDRLTPEHWCEITVIVNERPAAAGMAQRYDVTYTARYSGNAADCARLHPLTPRPSADTDGVIVPVLPATTELLRIMFDSDETIIEAAGRQFAGLPRSPKHARERAASTRRAAAMRALAEFWY